MAADPPAHARQRSPRERCDAATIRAGAILLGMLTLGRAQDPAALRDGGRGDLRGVSEPSAPPDAPIRVAGLASVPPELARWPSGDSGTAADARASLEWVRVADGPVPTWPRRPSTPPARDAELMARILDGTIGVRPDPIPAPPRYAVNASHLRRCTSCFEGRYRRSLHRLPFAPRPGEAQLLLDDHAVERHACVARVRTRATKRALELRACGAGAQHCSRYRERHFGMYGTVLPPIRGAYPLYRMWLGNRYVYYAESADGLRWSAPELTRVGGWSRFEMCVSHDARRGRLLMGHHCGNLEESVCLASAPAGARANATWHALGVGPPRPGKEPAIGPGRKALGPCDIHFQCCGERACSYHADSYSCVRWAEADGAHWLVKRAAFGNAELPSQWRAVRGVVLARSAELDTERRDRVRTFDADLRAWYLDREGKAERFRRQVYSLTLSDLDVGSDPDVPPDGRAQGGVGDAAGGAPAARAERAADAPSVGVLTLLHWPGVGYRAEADGAPVLPPYSQDVTAVYLLPTRDSGRTFDLSAVYADTPSLQPSPCAPAADAAPKDAWHGCPFDHGYVQPASELLSVRPPRARAGASHGGARTAGAGADAGQLAGSGMRDDGGGLHTLYYEGRPTRHSQRFRSTATIARASWPLHRLAGVRADPACAALPAAAAAASVSSAPCGRLETRAFEWEAAHGELALNARADGEDAAVLVELLDDATGEPLGSHGRARVSGVDAADVRVAWPARHGGARAHAQPAGRRVRLRFELCGQAVLFAFTLHRRVDSD